MPMILVAAIALSQPAPPVFPDDWKGHWEGSCHQLRPASDGLEPFVMELIVEPIDPEQHPEHPEGSWTWTIVYAMGNQRQERPYVLVPTDPEQGLWVIDERNSIELDATIIGDVLYSQFEIAGSTLAVSYRIDRHDEGPRDDTMTLEIVSFDSTNARDTGGEAPIPEVRTMKATSVQRCELERMSW